MVKVVEVPPGPPVLSTLAAEVYGPHHGAGGRKAGGTPACWERRRLACPFGPVPGPAQRPQPQTRRHLEKPCRLSE